MFKHLHHEIQQQQLPPAPSSALLVAFIPEDQFAREIGISLRTARAWRKSRIGPAATQIGRKFFYRVETVQRWLLARELKAPRERGGRRLKGRAHAGMAA